MPPLSCLTETVRPNSLRLCTRQLSPRLRAGVDGARLAKGSKLKNIRKTFGLATIAGALAVAPMALGPAPRMRTACQLGCRRGLRVRRQLGIATGNGYYGGLQFTMGTWRSNGGSGSPHKASREEQIRVAENVLRSQGIGAWPSCGRRG